MWGVLMQITRRKFFKVCAGGMAGTSVAMLGFAPATALAAPREYKPIACKRITSNLYILLGKLRYVDV